MSKYISPGASEALGLSRLSLVDISGCGRYCVTFVVTNAKHNRFLVENVLRLTYGLHSSTSLWVLSGGWTLVVRSLTNLVRVLLLLLMELAVGRERTDILLWVCLYIAPCASE